MGWSKDPRPTLVSYGAPLAGVHPARDMPLVEAVLQALKHVEDDSSLPLVLPVVLAKSGASLDYARLLERARELHVEARLGMLLDMTAEVTPLHGLHTVAEQLYSSRNREPEYLPPPQNTYAAQLAQLRTPPVVRRWGFLMNLREESLRAFVRKHLGA